MSDKMDNNLIEAIENTSQQPGVRGTVVADANGLCVSGMALHVLTQPTGFPCRLARRRVPSALPYPGHITISPHIHRSLALSLSLSLSLSLPPIPSVPLLLVSILVLLQPKGLARHRPQATSLPLLTSLRSSPLIVTHPLW
eukprot:TRINITY_DN1612_c0_g1_i2.p1 TRINITY_DN1612_c0_g1~~TRINITY_DN1612_c0_g1_i2.p1  ORF type:complete len:141 (+),score=13.87 TRINITY_DN1612_c0_g1_i2:187-609(+)